MKGILLLALLSSLPLSASQSPRVLLVASNQGFDFGELAQAHALFQYNGFDIDVATPAGGKATPKAYDENASAIATFLTHDAEKLADTVAIADVDTARYEAMFLVGGSGAMLEFPSHAALQAQIATMANRGAVIGAVCHGPAALRDVKLANGLYLVEGKRVSAFTAEEEARFGGKTAAAYPFVLEHALRERGAQFVKSPMMLVQVSRDGSLVTGQNPFSTSRTVEEVLRATGRTPKPRRPDRDEATILLIADILGTGSSARLHDSPADYDVELIGRYGALLAESGDVDDLRGALALLEAAAQHTQHLKVKSALERVRSSLTDNAKRENDDCAKAAYSADRRPE